jgi:hypothetical protein
VVIDAFNLRREDASGQFVHFQMVADAFAAFTFAGTRLVSAVAFGFIGFKITFHF